MQNSQCAKLTDIFIQHTDSRISPDLIQLIFIQNDVESTLNE